MGSGTSRVNRYDNENKTRTSRNKNLYDDFNNFEKYTNFTDVSKIEAVPLDSLRENANKREGYRYLKDYDLVEERKERKELDDFNYLYKDVRSNYDLKAALREARETREKDELEKDGEGDLNKYTQVGNYDKGKGEDWQKVIDIEKEDDDDKRFAEDTKIPVMTGDLYNVAVGHIDFLDVNFLTGNKDHDEGSPWMILRNFAAGLIHISIYIASAILLVMLIIYGIQIVGHSFDNPEGEAEAKTRLEQFTTSIAMLIGSVVIMGLCIFGSDTFFKSLENRENAELPIRVNVETAGYSFSTTAAGYARYMAGIEDVDEWVEKGLYTLGFIVLAWVNLAVIIFMIVRMFALWILSMIGPIAAALHILNIEGMMSFRRWAGLYISLSLIQVLLSMIYTLILNYAI